MYSDYSPVPNHPNGVIVVEDHDMNVEEVIKMARDYGTTTIDGDGDEIFWIVFADKPRRMWDMTEGALRSDFRRRNKAT